MHLLRLSHDVTYLLGHSAEPTEYGSCTTQPRCGQHRPHSKRLESMPRDVPCHHTVPFATGLLLSIQIPTPMVNYWSSSKYKNQRMDVLGKDLSVSKPLVRNDRKHQPGPSRLYRVSSCIYPLRQQAITSAPAQMWDSSPTKHSESRTSFSLQGADAKSCCSFNAQPTLSCLNSRFGQTLGKPAI